MILQLKKTKEIQMSITFSNLQHIKEYNELEDLIGDLKSMGYTGKVGYAINFMGYEINYWNVLVMKEEEEKKAIQVLLKSFYPWYDKDKISTLEDFVETVLEEDGISNYEIFSDLKPKSSVKPSVIQFGGTNPFRVVKELEKIFEGPLYDAFSGSQSGDLEIEEI